MQGKHSFVASQIYAELDGNASSLGIQSRVARRFRTYEKGYTSEYTPFVFGFVDFRDVGRDSSSIERCFLFKPA